MYSDLERGNTYRQFNNLRVFLPIQSNGEIECPYCGTIYQLNGELPHHHAPTLSGGH
ncbi:MAG: zinc-finger domain-containing protein [Kingella oralis]